MVADGDLDGRRGPSATTSPGIRVILWEVGAGGRSIPEALSHR